MSVSLNRDPLVLLTVYHTGGANYLDVTDEQRDQLLLGTPGLLASILAENSIRFDETSFASLDLCVLDDNLVPRQAEIYRVIGKRNSTNHLPANL